MYKPVLDCKGLLARHQFEAYVADSDWSLNKVPNREISRS